MNLCLRKTASTPSCTAASLRMRNSRWVNAQKCSLLYSRELHFSFSAIPHKAAFCTLCGIFLNINIVEVLVNAFEEIKRQNDYDKDIGEPCPDCACANCERNAFGAQP